MDAGFCLFGNSAGFKLRDPFLSTIQMLDLIIATGQRHPNAFHIAYFFKYDVNWILKDVDKLHIAVLHLYGHVTWQGYRIEYIPDKIFTVSKKVGERRIKVRIDDIFSYFRSRYDKALKKYGIGSPRQRNIITAGKENRSDFWYADIVSIEWYWNLELQTMVWLMDLIRGHVNSADFFIGSWHGPGALASYALKTHSMGDHKLPTSEDMIEPFLTAYAGGWFNPYKVGFHDGPVYTADINSAYAYAISLLPSLATGTWKHISRPDPQLAKQVRLGCFHIKYNGSSSSYMASCHGMPLPLFMRQRNGSITRPIAVDGWYWNPEASIVADRPDCEFIEAWILIDDGTYPFAWVRDMYNTRLDMITDGNPAEKVLKWTLASIYGREAQRCGWDEKNLLPPPWHQIEWAGFTTSLTRAMIYWAAMFVSRNNGLVSVDTDGIMSISPVGDLRNGISEDLGAWKVEEFSGLIYIQNGIYWLRDMNGEWKEPKLRGLPKGRKVNDPQMALDAFGGNGVITVERHKFVSYGTALYQNWSKWRTWEDSEHKIRVGRSGDRQHIPQLCRACKQGYTFSDCLHDMALVPSGEIESQKHKVPWREPQRNRAWEIIQKFGGGNFSDTDITSDLL